MSILSIIIDGVTRIVGSSGNVADVDPSGNLKVISPTPTPPPGTNPVRRTFYEDVAGNDYEDDIYTIPSGETLTLQRLISSSEDNDKSCEITMVYLPNTSSVPDPDDLLTTPSLHDNIIVQLSLNGNNEVVDLEDEFLGDTTNGILVRMRRTDGGRRRIYTRWVGYTQ